MSNRASSPAASESGFDLAKALFKDDDSFSSSRAHGAKYDNDEDDEAFIAAQLAASNRKSSNVKSRGAIKGGGFQVMGLNSTLLKAIARKGFNVPTPIQRKIIPMVLDGQDAVGMARTGSGKTAAFVIPMVEKLKVHSAKFGARALILSPSRELAMQTLKVVKELTRGTDLKSVLLVGGDALEDQFSMLSSNQDILVATPGRFLHLKIEMDLDLSSIKYVVFDEADRLFEMGFAVQLNEILHALPASRQTLLFSATMPTSLVEFTKAGLQEPRLVRLNADSKISPDLESAFFTVKSGEKEGALLHVIQDVIKIPMGEPENAKTRRTKTDEEEEDNSKNKNNKKRKRSEFEGIKANETPTPHSTIVFVATKHHVEYLASLLRTAGYAVSHVYGSLDQTARRIQIHDFRSGMTNIMVVTDVAARGIDIPILSNVINYDFPSQPKVFVHRVGRTARAGQRGWAYSFVCESDAPYLLDLQLFLGRRLIVGRDDSVKADFTRDMVLGALSRDAVERTSEWANKLVDDSTDVTALQVTAKKGEKLYVKSRNSASSESAKRAKDLVGSDGWKQLHALFSNEADSLAEAREKMLARVSNFRPHESVFEIGNRGNTGDLGQVMRKVRHNITAKKDKEAEMQAQENEAMQLEDDDFDNTASVVRQPEEEIAETLQFSDTESDDDLEVTITQPSGTRPADSKSTKTAEGASEFRDSQNYISYFPSSIAGGATETETEKRGYSVHAGGSSFMAAARSVAMDLQSDEAGGRLGEPSRARMGGAMRWDKKGRKYVRRNNDEDGSRDARKLVKSESGQKIAASFKAGKFDEWRRKHRVGRLPRIGEVESTASTGSMSTKSADARRFKHHKQTAPKAADKFRDDYMIRKKRVEEAKKQGVGKFGKDSGAKDEVRGVEGVQKMRHIKEKRREKNARPSRKK